MTEEEAAQLLVDAEQRVARVIVTVPAVDLAVEAPLRKVLQDAAQADVERLEIDLTAVAFADSNVVRLALEALEWVAPTGAKVAITAPPAILRLFDVTGTAERFEIVEPA